MPARNRAKSPAKLNDHITDALLGCIGPNPQNFNEVFEQVFDKLKADKIQFSGEEMLRLRAYEVLQNLVVRGSVTKEGKTYTHVPS